MNERARSEPMMQVPTPAEAQRAVDQARRLYHRVLPAWVCDLLALRRAGMSSPNWSRAHTDMPGREAA
jgi:hypothetical protein